MSCDSPKSPGCGCGGRAVVVLHHRPADRLGSKKLEPRHAAGTGSARLSCTAPRVIPRPHAVAECGRLRVGSSTRQPAVTPTLTLLTHSGLESWHEAVSCRLDLPL